MTSSVESMSDSVTDTTIDQLRDISSCLQGHIICGAHVSLKQ